MKFCHLHLHTHYSLLDGATRIPDLIAHCQANGMEACSVTDHGTLAGIAEMLRESKERHFKPIIGMEAYVAPQGRFHRSGRRDAYHLTLLAKDGEGVRNLMRLSSLGFLEGYYYTSRIDKEILERHSKGLICLSGCASSEFSDLILKGDEAGAEKLAAWYRRVFGDDFYIEIQDNGIKIQHDCTEGASRVARRMGLPMVATSDAHYLRREDAFSHDILLCINTHKTINDKGRMRFETDQGALSSEFYVRSPEEMASAMGWEWEEEIARTGEIAEGIEEGYGSLDFGRRQFPAFAVPGGYTAETYLDKLCRDGLKARYGNPSNDVIQRYEHEYEIVCRMGYASYFLIVWDVVRYARENGIPVSARGSACGAVISYVLYISGFCPLKHDLLFERFLDPNRSDPPDIDIDMCKVRRGEIIDYVKRKYGDANVAQIGTVTTLQPRAVMKDVARALGVDMDEVVRATDLIPQKLGTTLKGTYENVDEFRIAVEKNVRLKSVYGNALKIEGTAKSAGTHAAGVVIAPRPLIELVPLERDKEGAVRTQWGMHDLEKAGMMKMDFLGLRNMSMLTSISKMLGGIDLDRIPKNDAATFELLRKGDAKGVFQLDGEGMRDVLVRVAPDRIDDISAIIAMYRPGPLECGMVDDYVDVKHGKKQVSYVHPITERILKDTYGIMLFQEQIMMILNIVGGLELSRAYQCIKAISKKKPDQIAKFGDEFITGATKTTSRQIAVDTFESIKIFGHYCFNRSHSAAYAYLAYHTAYFKANHPAVFMAALLSNEMEGSEREKYLVEHIYDCSRMGIAIAPPDVNKSELGFTPVMTQKKGAGVRFGLGAIKGVSAEALAGVVAARGDKPFKDIYDFVERTNLERSKVEILVRVGAMDSFGPRAAMIAALPKMVKGSKRTKKDVKRGQGFLFVDDDCESPPLPEVEELSESEKARDEHEILGFYLKSNPAVSRRDEIAKYATCDSSTIVDKYGTVRVGGMVTKYEEKDINSRGEFATMARFSVIDVHGSIPCVMWPDVLARVGSLKEGDVGFITGSVDRRRGVQVIAERFTPIDRAAGEFAKGILLHAGPGTLAAETMGRLRRIAAGHPGPLEVCLKVGETVERLGAMFRVRMDDELRAKFAEIVDSVELVA